MSNLEPREELARIAASLRAYLEWQVDCGSSGIPRRPREQRVAQGARPIAAELPPQTPREAAHDASAPSRSPEVVAPSAPVVPAPIQPKPPASSDASRKPSPLHVTPRPLPVIQEEVKGCTKCRLHSTRTNTVFARGNIEAKLCFVGEAPGADEDAQGLPFVGRAGQLLDRMIRAMGLDPEKDVYICNIIKCRPPGNRRPEPDEVEQCIPYLHEQLAHCNPRVIVALGNTAVASLLGTKLGITKVRGSWKLYAGKIPVMPTYHPSYLLRPSPTQAEAKRQAWEDLQAVMKELGLSRPATRA